MKRRCGVVIVMAVCGILGFGCQGGGPQAGKTSGREKGAADGQPARPPVNSVELAEVIMRPAPYIFKFQRDPFKPIAGKGIMAVDEKAGVNPRVDLRLKAIVIREGAAFALIESPSATRVYRVKDSVPGGFIVGSIEDKKVILKQADTEIELKIGGEKKHE